MQLREFYDYKNQLMKDLLTNPEIVRLLDEDISVEDAKQLAYTRVFPCEYVPETVEHGATYICFDVDIQEAVNKTFLLPTLYIWIFTHKSKIRLLEGGLRVDDLCAEVACAINGSRSYGLGELNLHSVKRFAPMTDYQGKVMTFHAVDFNRVYTHNKYTPENRKSD